MKFSLCFLLLLILSLGCKTESSVPDRSLTSQERASYEAGGYKMLVLEMRQEKKRIVAKLVSGRINPEYSTFIQDKVLSDLTPISDAAEITAKYLLDNPETPRRVDVCYYLFSASYQSESNSKIITSGITDFTDHLKKQSGLQVVVEPAPRHFLWQDYTITR
jgi:hypothetical protein